MGITISYKVLFEVVVCHHYYLDEGTTHYEGMSDDSQVQALAPYSVSEIFRIVPTSQTEKVLKAKRLLFKATAAGFIIGTATDPDSPEKAFVEIGDNLKLCFDIFIRDPLLFNFTSIRLNDNKGLCYHFSNVDRDDDHFPSLVQLASSFDSSLALAMENDGDPDTFAYLQGDLIVDNPDNPTKLFEAQRNTNDNTTNIAHWKVDTPGSVFDEIQQYEKGDKVIYPSTGKQSLYRAIKTTTVNDPSDTEFWQKLRDLPLGYVNSNDRISILPSYYNHTFSIADETVVITIRDINDDVVFFGSHTRENNQEHHQFDLNGIPEGLCKMSIIKNPGNIILSDQLYYKTGSYKGEFFGAIEISGGDGNGLFSLVDDQDACLSPVFEIRFKNRSTWWHYLDTNDDSLIQEAGPFPLTKEGYIKVEVDGAEQPNPDAQMIKPKSKKIISEIYIKR